MSRHDLSSQLTFVAGLSQRLKELDMSTPAGPTNGTAEAARAAKEPIMSDTALLALVDAITSLPLGQLALASERVRWWIARELTPEILDYLYPTLDTVAIEYGLSGREVARKLLGHPSYAITVVIPNGPDRVTRAAVERDKLLRQIQPPPVGGTRKWAPTEDALAEAKRRLLDESASTLADRLVAETPLKVEDVVDDGELDR